MTSTSMAASDLQKHENELLSLLEALTTLERRFNLDNRFNLFEAVNMVRQEIRHSRFLAFLLDPYGLHGLGDRFLRGMLSAAVAEHPTAPVSKLAVAITDLSGASVHCERDHFDITVEVPALELLFVIENKIDAAEGADQLENYRTRATNNRSDMKFLGCFLTPDGYAGSDDQWVAMAYSTIAAELRRATEDISPASDVAMAIRHYIHLIESKIMVSPQLISACKEIYRQHKAALDLIFEHGLESPLSLAFDQFVSGQALQVDAMATRSTRIFFQFKSWPMINGFPEADRKRWPSNFPVLLWFEALDKRIYLRIELGPLQDRQASRSELVALLREELRGPAKKKDGDIFTRIWSHPATIPEDPSIEELTQAMTDLWHKKSVGVEHAVRNALEEFARRSAHREPGAAN